MSIWHWLIVLLIVVVVFGTRKLSGAGTDLGQAVKNFKKAMHEGEAEAEKDAQQDSNKDAIDGEKRTTPSPDQPNEASKAEDHAGDTHKV